VGAHCKSQWQTQGVNLLMAFVDKDLVTISPSLSITNKSFGVASSTNGIDGSFDGILCVVST
jgi:hypothetical protein